MTNQEFKNPTTSGKTRNGVIVGGQLFQGSEWCVDCGCNLHLFEPEPRVKFNETTKTADVYCQECFSMMVEKRGD